MVLVSEGQISEHPVQLLSSQEIIDTNGAGDAFVGGFLAMLVQVGREIRINEISW